MIQWIEGHNGTLSGEYKEFQVYIARLNNEYEYDVSNSQNESIDAGLAKSQNEAKKIVQIIVNSLSIK